MGVARRPVAVVTAVVLVLEAAGVVLLNWFLSLVVDKQKMSLAGLEPSVMSTGAWVAGVVFGLYLLLCAGVLIVGAVRDGAPGGFARAVLIGCAVVHGLLGAFSVGLVGWAAFAATMVVLALIVLSLLMYGPERDGTRRAGKGGDEGTGASGGPVAV